MSRVWLKDEQTYIKDVDFFYRHKVRANVHMSVVPQEGEDAFGDLEMKTGVLFSVVPLVLLEENDECKEDWHEPFEVFDGHAGMHEPIVWWRALKALVLVESIDACWIHDFYWAMLYHDRGTFHFSIDRVCEYIGEEAYQHIMQASVPEYVLDSAEQMIAKGFDLYLSFLSDEVKAGTLRWSQRLKNMGVKHPDYWNAWKKAFDVIVEQYYDTLKNYAMSIDHGYTHNHDQKSFLMIGVECALVGAVDRGIDREYGGDVAVLFAIIFTQLGHDQVQEELEEKYQGRLSEWRKPFVRPPVEQRYKEAMAWGRRHFGIAMGSRYSDLLHELYVSYDELPILHPLVVE
jgi:hypothetical protein